MTNTQKQKLALLIHRGKNTAADIRQALPNIAPYLEAISSPYAGDDRIIYPDTPLERDAQRYPPETTFKLTEHSQDILDEYLERQRSDGLSIANLVLVILTLLVTIASVLNAKG